MKKKLLYYILIAFVLIGCTENDIPIVNAPETIINPYISPYDSTVIVSAVLRKDLNENVLKDIRGVVEGHSIVFESPYIVDARNLTVSFETTGGGILSSNEYEVPDTTVSFNLLKKTVFCTEGKEKQLQYYIECYYSGLPILEINTPDGVPITSKEEWITDAFLKLINIDGKILNEGTLSIKGRGNATWTMDKKSYALKLDEKAEVLGMPADKRWVLLPNSKDHTLIKNALGLEVARQTNLSWTPQGRYVELVLNGVHCGNYFLTEKIKRSKNRVNITNGFILEMDGHFDEEYKFRSLIKNIPYMFKDPDDVIVDQFEFVESLITKIEDSIYDDEKFAYGEYLNYIDLDSFVDWWIALELTQNQEPNHPASCFCYINDEKKMVMGPVWDYDVYTFNSHYRLDTLAIRDALYYDKLFETSLFIEKLKTRWTILKPIFQTYIPQFLNSTVNYIHSSALLDLRKWPYEWTIDTSWFDLNSPYNDLSWFDSYSDYDNAIEVINNTFQRKLENVDIFIKSL